MHLPTFLDQRIDGETSVGIASRADGHARRHLVLTLNGLSLRSLNVGREGHEQVAGYTLLYRDVRACRGP